MAKVASEEEENWATGNRKRGVNRHPVNTRPGGLSDRTWKWMVVGDFD